MSTIPKTIEQVLFDNEKLLQDLFYKQTAEDQADDFLNKVDAVRRLLNAAFQAGREHVGESKWIPVTSRPLIEKVDNGWVATEDGMHDFIAAVELVGGKWWIQHCRLEDETGLVVVYDDSDGETEDSGWTPEDVTFWMPWPSPPSDKQP